MPVDHLEEVEKKDSGEDLDGSSLIGKGRFVARNKGVLQKTFQNSTLRTADFLD